VERRRSVAAVAVRSSVMPYLASIALDDRTGRRRDERRVLEEAHRVVSQVTPGPGRPRQRGGDHLARAFILRIYSEFQAFVRELRDVMASVLMRGLDVPQSSHPPLIAARHWGAASIAAMPGYGPSAMTSSGWGMARCTLTSERSTPGKAVTSSGTRPSRAYGTPSRMGTATSSRSFGGTV
jgi:hypothetical protein